MNLGVQEVYLIARWTYYTDGGYSGEEFSFIGLTIDTPDNKVNSREAFLIGLRETIDAWHGKGIKVNITFQVPQQKYEPQKITSKQRQQKTLTH